MTNASNHAHDAKQVPELARGPGRRPSLALKPTAIAGLLAFSVLAAGCGSSGSPAAPVAAANGAAVTTRYTLVRVRKGDHWEISQLNEREAPPLSAYSKLAALEWMVGTWQDKSGDQTVQAKINWAGDKNFLVRTINVQGGDQSVTDGWEIIGWDPVRQQIHSWIFDSNGGFGEATWANNGEDWLIRASNVLPDGSRSTAENVLTKVDGNRFTWESQNRTLNGEPQPSLDKIEVQRVAGSQ